LCIETIGLDEVLAAVYVGTASITRLPA